MAVVTSMMDAIAAASVTYMEAVESKLATVKTALEAYEQAEARNLGDFSEGRYATEANEAWEALKTAREALQAKATEAEATRQATVQAAITAAGA
jgi:hypothetical protein